MPAMPRMSGKARKIAFNILGHPQNVSKPSRRQLEIDRVINAQSTNRTK